MHEDDKNKSNQKWKSKVKAIIIQFKTLSLNNEYSHKDEQKEGFIVWSSETMNGIDKLLNKVPAHFWNIWIFSFLKYYNPNQNPIIKKQI